MMVSFFHSHRHHAAVSGLAVLVLELNGRVVDAKLHCQTLLHVAQYRLARRWRNVGDRYVTGQRMHLRSNAPDMEIVHITHAVHLLHRTREEVHTHSLRSSLEQYVKRLANDAERGPKDECADPERKSRIDPGLAGK